MTQPALGTVYGIGIGPGDPKLVTVRAAEVLGEVPVVIAPGSSGAETGLALGIARPYLAPDCRVIVARLPMTENRAELRKAWEETAREVAAEASAGRDVAFVTLGDSTLYSTWAYVAATLGSIAPEVPIETIPGVTAMAACAALSGISLAQGREPLLIWPLAPTGDLQRWLDALPNVVLMKAGPYLEKIAELAESSGHEALAYRRVGLPAAASTPDLRSWSDESDYLTTVIMKRHVTTADAQTKPEGGE